MRKQAAEEAHEGYRSRHQQLHTSRWDPPHSFFDKLSKVHLCPRALRELDYRTTQPSPLPQLLRRKIASPDYASLKRFARLGGPSLDDVRSYPAFGRNMPSRRNAQSHKSGSTKPPKSSRSRSRKREISAYDPNFVQHLEDHSVFLEGFDDAAEPDNLATILTELEQRRVSLSPSRFSIEDFLQFKKYNRDAKSETGIMNSAFRTIIGQNDIPNQQNVPFNNLAPLTDGSLTTPQPDYWDGCRPQDVDKTIRHELSDSIVPSTNLSNPVLPNFFAEGKGPSGNPTVAIRQACYDAACGARAIYSLRKYVDPSTAVDGNAYTISATYRGGPGGCWLCLWATHVVASTDPDLPVQYHMTQLGQWAMTSNLHNFCQGAAAIRNARDWAQKRRASLVTAANAKASTTSTPQARPELNATLQSNTDIHETNTSADEVASDHRLHRVSSIRSLPTASHSQISSTAKGEKLERRRSLRQIQLS